MILSLKEKIDFWLKKMPNHIGEGEISTALETVRILEGWEDHPFGTETDENGNPLLYVVYVIAKDADPYASTETGFISGKDMEELEEKLKEKFQLQRGIDSSWSGFYFWLIPATSISEAYKIACIIWHEYLQAKSAENHPLSPDSILHCPYSGCEYSN